MKERFKSAIKGNSFIVWLRIIYEKIGESFSLTLYNGSTNQTKDIYKKQAELQIRIHALEKGMSIGRVRVGFGKEKAFSLIEDLADLLKKGGSKQFVVESVSVLQKYIEFNENMGAAMADIEIALNKLCSCYNIKSNDVGGIYNLSLKDVSSKTQCPFDSFSQSRFSIRDFGDSPLDIDKVYAALKLCERTPSACNRQSWVIHVYTENKLVEKMFKLQGGSKGFYEQMQCAILICGDLRNYGFYEQNLPFVDGGLYAMNLLYSLHYNGLATIPLTMGHKWRVIKKIKQEMNIPGNEIPVLLIGVGTYKDDFKVAVVQPFIGNEVLTVFVHLGNLRIDVTHWLAFHSLYFYSTASGVEYFQIGHSIGQFHYFVLIYTIVGCQVPAEISGQYGSGTD